MSEGFENAGYTAFCEALVAGRLRLGQTLKQEELCEVLGIKLSPMRETTTLLESEGLISVRRKVGITIFYPDVDFIGNAFQFRGILEREAVRKFASVLPAGWIERMRRAHAEIIDFVQRVNDLGVHRVPVRQLEYDFHRSFIGALGNAEINKTYGRLSQKMYLIRLHNLQSVNPTSTVVAMQEHLAIIDALEQRDADAAIVALDRHLQGVLHRVLTT